MKLKDSEDIKGEETEGCLEKSGLIFKNDKPQVTTKVEYDSAALSWHPLVPRQQDRDHRDTETWYELDLVQDDPCDLSQNTNDFNLGNSSRRTSRGLDTSHLSQVIKSNLEGTTNRQLKIHPLKEEWMPCLNFLGNRRTSSDMLLKEKHKTYNSSFPQTNSNENVSPSVPVSNKDQQVPQSGKKKILHFLDETPDMKTLRYLLEQLHLKMTKEDVVAIEHEDELFQIRCQIQRVVTDTEIYLRAGHKNVNYMKVEKIRLKLAKQEEVALDHDQALFQLARELRMIKYKTEEKQLLTSNKDLKEEETQVLAKIGKLEILMAKLEKQASAYDEMYLKLMRALRPFTSRKGNVWET